MASDRNIRANVRARLGLTNDAETPDDELDREIAYGKKQISAEIRERLDDGATLDFDGAAEEALQNFVYLRVDMKKNPGEGRGPPGSVSELARANYDDPNHEHYRSRVVSAMSRIQ